MINIELFIQGAEKIDRQRKIITRVIISVLAQINKKLAKNAEARKSAIFEMPINEVITLQFKYMSGSYGFGVQFFYNNDYVAWWSNYGDSIPSWAVPIVFSKLAEIVEKADAKLPAAEIKKAFQFFAKQALNQ